MICDFGCNNVAIKQFGSGRWCCASHTSSCPAMKKKNNLKLRTYLNYDWSDIQKVYDTGVSHSEICVMFRFASSTCMDQAVRNGLFVSRTRHEAATLARSKGKGTLTIAGRQIVTETARTTIIQRYEAGWMPKAGRCKKFTHVSPIAGEVSLDGTWELAVAVWLDSKKYNWLRNTKRFPYINLKGSLSHYTPDFWVEELNGFLEVKGYETALDRCKWSQFKDPLTVWKKKELYKNQILI
jgi:hypothetical protein